MAMTSYYHKSAPWKSGVFFLILTLAWSYAVYCLSVYQSFFSLSTALDYLIDEYVVIALFFISLFFLWRLLYLGMGLIFVLVLLVFAQTSINLWNSAYSLSLILNLLFLVVVTANLYLLVKKLDLSAYRRRHQKRGFLGNILLKIPVTLTLDVPQAAFNTTDKKVIPKLTVTKDKADQQQKPEQHSFQTKLTGLLVDWDDESFRVQLCLSKNDQNLYEKMDKKLLLKLNQKPIHFEFTFRNKTFLGYCSLVLLDVKHGELGLSVDKTLLTESAAESSAAAHPESKGANILSDQTPMIKEISPLGFEQFKTLTWALGQTPEKLY